MHRKGNDLFTFIKQLSNNEFQKIFEKNEMTHDMLLSIFNCFITDGIKNDLS